MQATLGALWDAFEDIAVYMEVVKVQTLVEAPRGERPLWRLACGMLQNATRQCCWWRGVRVRAEQQRLGVIARTRLCFMFFIPPLALTRLSCMHHLRNQCFSTRTATFRVSGGTLRPAQDVSCCPALEGRCICMQCYLQIS